MRFCAVFCTVVSLAFASFGRALAEPTFSRDVWPILEQKCVSCHQPGEIAPMAFTNYKQVRPWARSIREAVLARAMPPWSAASDPLHSFRNDRSLSAEEIRTLVAWVDGGAPEGNALPENHAANSPKRVSLGNHPDLTARIPGFHVPQSGTLPYSFLIIPHLFPKDVWVRAASWRIENRQVIHHINAFVRPPGSSFLAGFPVEQVFVPTVAERGARRTGERMFDRRQLLLGYEPGYEPMPWLEDGAKFIPAGSDLIFEMHYTPNGVEVDDHSELALYFAEKPPSYRVLAVDTLRDLDLDIPPGDRNVISQATMTLGRDVRLLSIQPHMHLRGQSMLVQVSSEGKKETLLNVPRYDFRWQTTYVFRDPVPLPAGAVLHSTAAFDNSPSNKWNPDPAARVRWGDQTSEEMHIAFLELVIDATSDPDALFQKAPRMIGVPTAARQKP